MTGDELRVACSSGRVPECCGAIRSRLLRDSAYRGGKWRHFRISSRSGRWTRLTQVGEVEVPLIGGPSGAAHHSDSCVIVFIGIAADLESQLAEFTSGATWFSPDGRLLRVPSSVRAAARAESRKHVLSPLLVPRTKGKRT